MNNLLKSAGSLPAKDETPVISVSPITLNVPDRGMDLEVRMSAPVLGTNLPVILLSHGHGPSLYIPSADGYGPIVNFWASQGFVVIQPTHLNAKARGMDPEAAGGPAFWKSRVADMKKIIDQLELVLSKVPELSGRVNVENIAVAGHSPGGQTAGVLLGAHLSDANDAAATDVDMSDPRIKAGLIMAAPGNGGSDLNPQAAAHLGFSFLNPDFSHMATPTLVVIGDNDLSPHLTTRGVDWHADPYSMSPGDKWLLTIAAGEHGLGGIAGFDAKETTDEDPDMRETVFRMTAAWLRSIFDANDDAWTVASNALASNASALGHVDSK